ncbi:hypothetical protein B4Q13_22205, partial [Lacticaseibacillus rhamnosus]
GIANITYLPKSGKVVAFDTGPGNMVIDALVALHTGGKFDRGGRIAAAGKVNDKLFGKMLADRYYREEPPKSAGREQYGAQFVRWERQKVGRRRLAVRRHRGRARRPARLPEELVAAAECEVDAAG